MAMKTAPHKGRSLPKVHVGTSPVPVRFRIREIPESTIKQLEKLIRENLRLAAQEAK